MLLKMPSRKKNSRKRKTSKESRRRTKSPKSSRCRVEGVVYRKEKYNHGKADVKGKLVIKCGGKRYAVSGHTKTYGSHGKYADKPAKGWEKYVSKYWE